LELAELMRGVERTRHVPIIFLTAGARDPQRVFQGYEAGAVDFLFKPVDPHVLRSKADIFFQLHRQKAELAHNLRMNEMFVGILGHDLRNPLNSIVTGAHLLGRQLTDEAPRRTLGRMASSAGRMKDMIEQLMDLTRARLAGGIGFVRAPRPVDIAELVQRAADELRPMAGDREISVAVAGECRTFGDAPRLLQVFSNLLSNAVQHGAPGASISALVEARGDDVVVRVANQGVIPRDILPKIFDPFRGARSSSGSRGLGLGLFISQEIVKAHAGTIDVRSTDEDGMTTFTLVFPKKSAGERAPMHEPARRVLIVDDDEGIRDSLRDVFDGEGYSVETASNGREALDLLQDVARHPDVLILDLVMPDLDGVAVYEAMQADATLSRIPVVVSTSTPALAPKGALVIPKPANLDHLIKTVDELCRHG
ncbi:MAG TPA: hybrid sensor histidine kinase/response regulator, partial [Polyangia bacterium]|nr:hybrid sensor histidine kinase/response regulator [Polyangia bacterium]